VNTTRIDGVVRSLRRVARNVINTMLRPFKLQVVATPLDAADSVGTALALNAGRVLAGPFAGTQLMPEPFWGGAPELLGCYEEELHDAIERVVRLAPEVIVNIGCGDGYYAVGLARRLPDARVLAVDISEKARQLTAACARANAVAHRINVLAPDELAELATRPARQAWIVDCEGAELLYLDPVKYSRTQESMIIVECHDALGFPVTDELKSRFSPTHDVAQIAQHGRNPHAIPQLRGLDESTKWSLVNERRPAAMHWLVMTPRVRDAE
jgi:hypothetical protein